MKKLFVLSLILLGGCARTPIYTRRLPPQSRAYEAGFQEGRAAAAKDQYWSLRYRHHPDLYSPAEEATIYPIPVPEYDLHGSHIQPTTKNLIIPK
jgi:hypothetical protein